VTSGSIYTKSLCL